MARNAELFRFLNENVLTKGSDDQRKNALDALVSTVVNVDDDVNKFIEVLRAHPAIFDGHLHNAVPEILYEREGDPSVKTILRKAVEQRVKLGLKNADEQVLVSILYNNEQACRDYLKTKPQPKVMGVISDASIDGFTNEEIQAIRVEARKRLNILRLPSTLQHLSQDTLQAVFTAGDFNAALNNQIPGFAEWVNAGDVNRDKAREIVSFHYLKNYLQHSNINLAPALLAADANALKPILAGLGIPGINNAADLDIVLNNANYLRPIRMAMLEAHLNRQPLSAHFSNLMKATTAQQAKNSLGALGVNPPPAWIADGDLKEISQWAMIRYFQHQLNEASRLGIKAHAHLIDAFKALSYDEKNTFIAKITTEPAVLNHLINAKDRIDVIKQHFDKITDEKAEQILHEHRQKDGLKAIHNPVVAKILASVLQTLTAEQAAAINNAFIAANQYKPIDISQHDQYKAMVDSIIAPLHVVDKRPLYRAFQLSDDGAAFLQTADAQRQRQSIGEQHMRNQHLYAAYHADDTPSRRRLIEFLLGVQKTANPIINQEMIRHFLSNKKPYPAPIQDIYERHQVELEPLIRAHAKHRRHVALRSANPEVVERRTHFLNRVIEQTDEERIALTQKLDAIKQIKDINVVHLLSPGFQGASSEHLVKLKQKHLDIQKNSELVLDSLKRRKQDVQEIIEAIPEHAELDTNLPESGIQGIRDLAQRAANEIGQIDNAIREYEDIAKANKDILDEVDKVAKSERVVIGKFGSREIRPIVGGAGYEAAGHVKIRDVSAAELAGLAIDNPTAAQPLNVQQRDLERESVLYELVDKIPSGKIRVYDVACTPGAAPQRGVTPEKHTVGRFSEEVVGTRSLLQSGQATKSSNDEFKLLQFPKDGQAKIEFSMKMAMQILAAGVPTKEKPLVISGGTEEEVSYLWTALMIIGQNNPKMRFGKEAIKVNSPQFNPDTQLGTLWGYKKGSVYETEFKDNAFVKNAIVQMKEEASKVKLAESKETSVTKGYRSIMTEERKASIEETIRREGPTPKMGG
jgi:hypothetical protein